MMELREDKLNRQPFLNSLFSIINNFGNQGNKGLTILLNGKYGSGKTTTLGFIKEKNAETDDFSVIEYNAWENNLFDNPLIPVLNQINQLNSTKNKLKDTALQVVKKLPKIFLSTLANAHGVDLTALLENEDIFKEFKEYTEALAEYRRILTEYCKTKKVLFLVDELDRCLPEYQIKVLETIYHLLNIPDLIVVIALDKEQLERSIKNYFGDEKNIFGYLSKFIDLQIDLPGDNDLNFIMSLMKFECNEYYTETVKILIAKMFEISGFSVRECQRLVWEMNTICNNGVGAGASYTVHYWYPPLVAFVLITKYQHPQIYKKWFYKEKPFDYTTDGIAFESSNFYKFTEDIKNTKLKNFIEYLIKTDDRTGIPVSFLMNLINAFTSFRSINESELAEYIGLNIEEVMRFRTESRYPSTINKIIKQIKLLDF